MATKVPSQFETFQLSPQELHVATTFNHLQKAYFHNLRSEMAGQLIYLKPEEGKDREYFLQKAFLEGGIETLGMLAMMEPAEPTETETVEAA